MSGAMLPITHAHAMLGAVARGREDAAAMLQLARTQLEHATKAEAPAAERAFRAEHVAHFESLESYDAFRAQLTELRQAESALRPLAAARQAWESAAKHAQGQVDRFAEPASQGAHDAARGYRTSGSVDPRMALARRAMELDGR